jgi:hypothetical protein
VSAFGGDFRARDLDLVLSTGMAVGLPFACGRLLDLTGGAAAGLALYYVVCCVLVVLWRKGTLDYRRPVHRPWELFAVTLLIPVALAAIDWGALPRLAGPAWGVALTAAIWAPLNGFLEQLAWLYVLDSWRNRWTAGRMREVGLAVGIVLLVVLVTLIHVLFWGRFLPVAAPNVWSWAGIPLNLLLTAGYVLLYYQSRSMWPTFIVHTLVDLQLVLISGYSLIPDL